MAVNIPTGISAEVRLRAIQSMIIMKEAPSAAETGIRRLLLLPTSILPICGMTSPTQPIVPEMHTELAVTKVAPPTIRSL